MKEQNRRLSPKRDHESNQQSEVLWWFSTAIPEVIKDCTSDRNRAKIIGAGVLFTWLYATVAWIYFWSISITSPFIYISLGIFIGFGILTIDRMLISSMGKGRKNLVAIGFRVILAMFLGAFIAQPIILWMFEKDINSEVAIIHDQKTQEKRAELEALFSSETKLLNDQKTDISNETTALYQEVQQAESEYLKEIDGTGGSGNYGIAGIAREKKRALDRAQSRYDQFVAETAADVQRIDTRLNEITERINEETDLFKERDLDTGFLIRIEALQSLFDKDETGALAERYYLILIILVLFELIPIISKLYLPTGSYDEKVRLRDQIEIELAKSNTEKELSLKELYNQKAKEEDSELINNLFANISVTRKAKVEEIVKSWRASSDVSFDELWHEIKEELLSKQEG
ncbi:MAG: DUF4407 domain-containing protein [Bacteroidota bacterium]